MSEEKGHLTLDRLLTADEVAAYLGVPITTLYRWRTVGTGPRAARIGKHLRYRQADLESWVESQIDDPTEV